MARNNLAPALELKAQSNRTASMAMGVSPSDADPWDAPEPVRRSRVRFLRSNVAHYQLLSRSERKRLLRDIQTFVTHKTWEGCRGLTVTEEIQVTIAAQACLMLLGREHDCFRRVRSILVYPSGFKTNDEHWVEAGWEPVATAGLAVRRGPVILAWDVVLADAKDPSAGLNLVIHEFAHQLDLADGYADGTFDFLGEHARKWEEVLLKEFHKLRRNVRRGRESFFGDYAATSRSEFFARASERFFTQPVDFRHFHPELYDMLVVLYSVDPQKWFIPKG